MAPGLATWQVNFENFIGWYKQFSEAQLQRAWKKSWSGKFKRGLAKQKFRDTYIEDKRKRAAAVDVTQESYGDRLG